MSNHLREIFETKNFYDRAESAKTFEHDMDFIAEHEEEWISFYGGDAEEVSELKEIDELKRLPFDHCYFEFSGHTIEYGNVIMSLFVTQENNKIKVISCHRYNHEWHYLGKVVESDKNNKLIVYADEKIPYLLLTNQYYMALKFISAINCTNIKRLNNKPPDKLQKARNKKGKKPLFSYWTLDLDIDKSKEINNYLGGTHASPRVHLRRGHPRQYAPGKYCWVQPCAVGNKKLGMIHKDYSAKYHHAAVA